MRTIPQRNHSPTVVRKLKKIVQTYYIIIFSLVFLACDENREYGNFNLVNNYELTDFQSIISNPEGFYNDTLRVHGEISISSHNVSLTDGDFGIWIESFDPAVDFNTVYENLNMKEVELIGIYDRRENIFMDEYVGKFTKLLYIKIK